MAAGGAPNTRRRAVIVAALLVLGYMGVCTRLVYLQVIRQGDLYSKADRQQKKVITLQPKRGTIYDRRGRELAVSVDVSSLYGVPSKVTDPDAVAGKLAPVLGISRGELKDRLSGNRPFVWLARKLTEDMRSKVDAAGRFKEFIGWLPESRRYYPNRGLAGQVIGFTGMDNEGLEGLEKVYQGGIGGVPGKVVIEKDGAGRDVLSIKEGYIAPMSANDMVLTIDENIQYFVEKELDMVMDRYKPKSATAIVMDPNTGEILAMANRPTFNPNSWQDYRPASWRNRAVADTYEPGSTFKVITASAAIEEGVVRPTDIIDCGNGEVTVGDRVIHNSHKEGGPMRFSEVIQKSNNVGTVKVALRLGRDNLYKYAKAFGIGQKTGVELPGEVSGTLRDVKQWSPVSLAEVGIGQGTSVTALQMLTALNCIANGGSYVKPYIVSRLSSQDGGVISENRPLRVRRVVSQATARKITEILSTVVEEGGTAMKANIKGYQVAGKTGTAQKYDRALRGYSKEKFVGSFMGFCPADSPRVSAIVVVDEPKGEYYGGAVAAPAFRGIVEQTLTYMRVPTRLPEQTVLVERAG